MAIPDGPTAVCLSVLGFVCISAMKNRRVWMGLCLCVLSCGRVGASRLAGVGVAQPDGVDPDRPGDREPGHSLGQVCRPVVTLGTPKAPILGPCNLHSFFIGLCDDPGVKGLSPQTDAVSGALREAGPDDLGAIAPVGPLSVERIELARPPPWELRNHSG